MSSCLSIRRSTPFHKYSHVFRGSADRCAESLRLSAPPDFHAGAAPRAGDWTFSGVFEACRMRVSAHQESKSIPSCVKRSRVATKRGPASGALEGARESSLGQSVSDAPGWRPSNSVAPRQGRRHAVWTLIPCPAGAAEVHDALIPGASRGSAIPRSAPGYRPLPRPGQNVQSPGRGCAPSPEGIAQILEWLGGKAQPFRTSRGKAASPSAFRSSQRCSSNSKNT